MGTAKLAFVPRLARVVEYLLEGHRQGRREQHDTAGGFLAETGEKLRGALPGQDPRESIKGAVIPALQRASQEAITIYNTL